MAGEVTFNAADVERGFHLSVENFLKNRMQSTIGKRNWLLDNIKKEDYDGGPTIVVPIVKKENNTMKRFRGFDRLPIRGSNNTYKAGAKPTQYSMNVSLSGDDLTDNMGKSMVVSLIEAETTIAMDSIANQFSVDVYGNGVITNSIDGMQNIASTNPTDSFMGVDPLDVPNWKAVVRQMTAGQTEEQLWEHIDLLYMGLDYGKFGKPDLGTATHDIFADLLASIRGRTRFTDATYEANEGRDYIKYRGAKISYDENSDFGANSNTMYLFPKNAVCLKQHKMRKWTMEDPKDTIYQDSKVIRIFWKGQLVTYNRKAVGRLYV